MEISELPSDCIGKLLFLFPSGCIEGIVHLEDESLPRIDWFDNKRVGHIICRRCLYRDQILLEPLKNFWEESFGDVQEPIVMKDKVPVRKKVCIPVRHELGIRCRQHPPNSSDLDPIENI